MQVWTSRYGQTGIDGGNSIVTDNIGNVYVVGTGGISSGYDMITIKYSSSGKQEWLVNYNGPANKNDGAVDVKLDNEGNVIVLGEFENIMSRRDIVIMKYSPSGMQIWERKYTSAGNYNDFASSIVVDSLDNIYIIGKSYHFYVTIKYDSSGMQQWIDTYNDDENDHTPHAIAIDKDCNVYVTGGSGGDTSTLVDIATIKYNSEGTRQWVARFNSLYNENDYALDIGVDNEGNVYVCGGSQGDLYYDDYITVKYDSSGIEQWNRRYNGSDNFLDQARSLAIDQSNNVYITGYSTHSGTGYDFTTIKYNKHGDQMWLIKYNNGLNDMANKITIDTLNYLYITGESDGSGTNKDYAIIKYDSTGNELWVQRYDYSGQYPDYPSSIVVDGYGNVYVTGQSDRDFLTIKYSQLTGINTTLSEIPTEYKLYQNYPNPFNPRTVISYQLSVNSVTNLNVYDVLGNEVATLIKKKQNAGSYEVEFDGSNLSSGIYFYRLEVDGNVIDTKRMVLLK